jgi:epsilon-lactone hydrolase
MLTGGLFALALLQALAGNCAPSRPPEVVVDNDGTVHVPAFAIPLSRYMSDAAKKRFIDEIDRARDAALNPEDARDITGLRASVDDEVRPLLERAKELYPVLIKEEWIGGVHTQIVTPRGDVAARNRRRVLINLHGGGFTVGAGLLGLVESIPISSVGRFTVITVDYRMAPEYKFPAASEDVAAVYRALLKRYNPASIGIYGCSAGGSLAAMSAAWLQKHGMATPGAIGVFSSAAFGSSYTPQSAGGWSGDSYFTAPPLVGKSPVVIDEAQTVPPDAYLSNVDLSNPLVSPALAPSVLARFPPTLLITGTRAYDMSAAVQTQRQMTKAGIDAELHLWDGMGHCFLVQVDLPESREAFQVIARFFDKHLAR